MMAKDTDSVRTAATSAVRPKYTWRSVFDVVTTLAMLLLATGLFFDRRSQPPQRPPRPAITLPELPISIDGDASRGNPSATGIMIEYSDFQCPFCGSFTRETLPTLDAEYVQTGRVRFIFRHLPLPIHPNAQKAAEAAECAGLQGRFWEMHDSLFVQSASLDLSGFNQRATELDMDARTFEDCLKGATAENVRLDARGAGLFKITGTPSFLFGTAESSGRVKLVASLSGAQPISAFRQQLDRVAGQKKAGM